MKKPRAATKAPLQGKRVVLCVGGGIAAFKAVVLARELQRRGAEVRVAMTRSAARFVGPTSFSGLTGKAPVLDLWDPRHAGEVHVELGAWAEAMVVAPATANLLARAAAGMADDAVLATLSCAACPVLYAPAMHERMWRAAATQRNARRLEQDGAILVGPVHGALASGQSGMGRMAEPDAIADAVEAALQAGPRSSAARTSRADLAGKTVLISAGPTVEDIDPVRFISNRSSGRMGFALASAARDRGGRVVLVCGPVSIAKPDGVQLVDVRSAREMQRAIDAAYPRVDVVIMTAAIADYRPVQVASSKIKKKAERMSIELVKNPDILAGLGARRKGKRPVLVGFAMETDDLAAYARRKLEQKRCDLVVANEAAVFDRDDTQAILVGPDGDEPLPPMTKIELAHRILDRVVAKL
ncbi:MAG: bifunctional phosphopantothenoylcysteine decarboxylase/phosphopantothenate--cysteine ligase CoaBC [Polyangiales bacterium]